MAGTPGHRSRAGQAHRQAVPSIPGCQPRPPARRCTLLCPDDLSELGRVLIAFIPRGPAQWIRISVADSGGVQNSTSSGTWASRRPWGSSRRSRSRSGRRSGKVRPREVTQTRKTPTGRRVSWPTVPVCGRLSATGWVTCFDEPVWSAVAKPSGWLRVSTTGRTGSSRAASASRGARCGSRWARSGVASPIAAGTCRPFWRGMGGDGACRYTAVCFWGWLRAKGWANRAQRARKSSAYVSNAWGAIAVLLQKTRR